MWSFIKTKGIRMGPAGDNSLQRSITLSTENIVPLPIQKTVLKKMWVV
jgi:hypothetical protein